MPLHDNPLLHLPPFGDGQDRLKGQVYGSRPAPGSTPQVGAGAPPTGTAGGDLSGSYPSPLVRAENLQIANRVFARRELIPGNTGGAPSSGDIHGLTASDPDFLDELAFYDLSAAGNRKTTVGSLLGLQPATPGGRMGILTGNPWGDAGGANVNIYYTPAISDKITLWTGTVWRTISFTEATANLGGDADNFCYDLFGYLSAGGTLALEQLVWSGNNSRGVPITLQDGRYCKQGDKTRLYLGTFRTLGGTTIDSVTQRFIWNMYNRQAKSLFFTSGAGHTYAGGSRVWNGVASNMVELVVGIPDLSIIISLWANQRPNTTSQAANTRFGLDSATINYHSLQLTNRNQYDSVGGLSDCVGPLTMGYHQLIAQESADPGGGTFNNVAISAVVNQ